MNALHAYKNTYLQGDVFFIPSTQQHYHWLILLLNITYTATCFGRTTIFREKYIIS
jgi:hypothetical protein